jgi:hypothetical protein
LNRAYDLFNEARRDLRVRKDLKTLRAHVTRQKLLTGQLAAK